MDQTNSRRGSVRSDLWKVSDVGNVQDMVRELQRAIGSREGVSTEAEYFSSLIDQSFNQYVRALRGEVLSRFNQIVWEKISETVSDREDYSRICSEAEEWARGWFFF
jgi:hypothetical protein